MTLQEWKQAIFNKAWHGLASQNWRPSYQENNSSKSCMYRNGDDRCAVGYCIPDSQYSIVLEGLDALSVIDNIRPKPPEEVGDVYPVGRFLKELQKVHDNVVAGYSSFGIRKGMVLFAKLNSLSIPEEWDRRIEVKEKEPEIEKA